VQKFINFGTKSAINICKSNENTNISWNCLNSIKKMNCWHVKKKFIVKISSIHHFHNKACLKCYTLRTVECQKKLHPTMLIECIGIDFILLIWSQNCHLLHIYFLVNPVGTNLIDCVNTNNIFSNILTTTTTEWIVLFTHIILLLSAKLHWKCIFIVSISLLNLLNQPKIYLNHTTQ
jgi:hypothetical protein